MRILEHALLLAPPFHEGIPFKCLEEYLKRKSPSLEETLPDTKCELYGGSLLVQMYGPRLKLNGLPLHKVNKVSKTSTESLGDLGSERIYPRSLDASGKTTVLKGLV